MAHLEDGKLIVLGEKYIEKPQRQTKSLMPTMVSIAALAAQLDFLYPGYKKPRQRPEVNIIEEYELVQQKKSRLSKNDRDWVESQFHKHFIKVE
jgi:hypothetical protein